MKNNNNSAKILYKQQEADLTFKIFIMYLKRFVMYFSILETLVLSLLSYNALSHLEDVTTVNGQYLPKKVIIQYLNPFLTDTSAVLVGNFLATNFNVSPEAKIPQSLFKSSMDELTNNQILIIIDKYENDINTCTKIAFIIALLFVLYNWYRDDKKSQKEIHIRGNKLLDPKKVIQLLSSKQALLKIGNIPIPISTETRHILALGSSGSGKSTLLAQFLAQINHQVETAKDRRHYIITDIKPEFVGKFWKKGDFIFNPFDERSVMWNIFEEISNIADYDLFASALFATDQTKEPFWRQAASTVFADALKYLHLNGKCTNKDILNFFQQPLDDIVDELTSLPDKLKTSQQHLNASEATLSSIMSTLAEGLRPFRYLTDPEPGTSYFSFKKYIHEEYTNTDNTIPNLYLVIPANKNQILAPLLSLIMDIMISEILSLPEDPKCKLYFIVDELGSVNKINMLSDLITKGRSYGVSLIAMSQDSGLIRATYGTEVMKSFFNNFGTQVFLRINEANAAKEVSAAIGVKEVYNYKTSAQLANGDKNTPTLSREIETKTLVLASEFQMLPMFHGFLKTDVGICPIIIPKQFFKAKYSHFVPRKLQTIDDIKEQENQRKLSAKDKLKKLKGETHGNNN